MLLSDFANLLLFAFVVTGLYLALSFLKLPLTIAREEKDKQVRLIQILTWLSIPTLGLTWFFALLLVWKPKEIKGLFKKQPLKVLFNGLVLCIYIFSVYGVSLFAVPPQQTIHAKQLEAANYQEGKLLGIIENKAIVETSGISRSHKRDDLFFVHNDSKNEEVIYAVGLEGEDLASFRINDVTMIDWEATASYEKDGVPYIVIADVGDNKEERPYYNLYGLVEPDVTSKGESNIDLAWHMKFQYEDGPRNCEAMAIDQVNGEILFISKYDVPQRIYSIPIPDTSENKGIMKAQAKFLTELQTIPQPDLMETIGQYPKGIGNSRPTSFDISDDGLQAIILTYTTVYIYERDVDESWEEAFGRLPKTVPVPVRSEAIGFLDEKGSFYIIPEHGDIPLYRFERKE